MTKTCTICKETKEISEFRPHIHHKYGVASFCKICSRQRNNERYHRVLKGTPEHVARVRETNRLWYAKNIERHQAKGRRNHRLEREACFNHYGQVCACCGEHRYEFLSLDHIDGGGRQHSKIIGSKLARWLCRNGFPEGFRTLCHNCNQSLGHYGYCPHDNLARVSNG